MPRIKSCLIALAFLTAVFSSAPSYLAANPYHQDGQEHKPAKGVIVNKKDGSIMIYIPGGIFMMGSNNGDSDERPVHRVKLNPYYIDQFEVTNIQYRKFVNETNHPKPPYWDDRHFNQDLQPVVGVSWEDARTYAKWAGKRLPAEAEWELAARSSDGREYPWGNFWYDNRCNSDKSGYNRPVGVGNYPQGASPYGIHDTAGNVWEWCLDSYSKDSYRKRAENKPTGSETGSDKVLRGGSWGYDKINLRSSNRFWDDKDSRTKHFGFRCVRDVE